MNQQQKIQHLYWRAGFGLAPKELEQALKMPLQKHIDGLFAKSKLRPIDTPKMDIPEDKAIAKLSDQKKEELQKQARQLTAKVNSDWVERMIKPDASPLIDKMALFWHGHFACEPKFFNFAALQLNTLRHHALGNFRELVQAIAKDGAMILYLNNQQNRKNKPNENFARELMELFTIGRGNYTEQDIKESARAFTGWFTNRRTGEFEFNERAHDMGSKTFMGKAGNFDGQDIIEIVLARKETAQFIARKIYRFFVNELKEHEKHVSELAEVFFQSNYDIAAMMRHLFAADWFYEDANLGAKIKSPIELLVGMARVLDLKVAEPTAWLFPQRALGQVLFHPPNVAGWPGGKTWIDNATLLLRLNFAALLFDKAEVAFKLKDSPEAEKRGQALKKMEISANLAPLQAAFSKEKPEQLAQSLAAYLLQVSAKLDNPVFSTYTSQANSPGDQVKAWVLVLMSFPEYQLC